MKSNDALELGERLPALRAPRMTMARLPQWIVDANAASTDAQGARDDVPQRMTMSRAEPVVRTTIGRQR